MIIPPGILVSPHPSFLQQVAENPPSPRGRLNKKRPSARLPKAFFSISDVRRFFSNYLSLSVLRSSKTERTGSTSLPLILRSI